MGYALAQAAWRRGAAVTLVTGPSALPPPEGVDLVPVETAEEMLRAVEAAIGSADVSIFAAAVADFRPEAALDRKVKRGDTGGALTLRLTANPDIAAETRGLRKPGSVTVGFALETHALLDNAKAKLDAKGFHLLVANDATEAGSGFEVDTNKVTLLDAAGGVEELPLQSKDGVAEAILDRVSAALPEVA
jgi:phosphopantothenoylcysteine decarboxylase/phosphopantothenate--cysteine ligase